MLVAATDVLAPDTPATSPVALSASTATPIFTPAAYVDLGPSPGGATIPAATEHNGVMLSADSSNAAEVYLLLGAGTVSAANWHIALPPGMLWDGTVGGCVWRGAVSGFSTSSAKVGVAVV